MIPIMKRRLVSQDGDFDFLSFFHSILFTNSKIAQEEAYDAQFLGKSVFSLSRTPSSFLSHHPHNNVEVSPVLSFHAGLLLIPGSCHSLAPRVDGSLVFLSSAWLLKQRNMGPLLG
jgi:hypothetical protein